MMLLTCYKTILCQHFVSSSSVTLLMETRNADIVTTQFLTLEVTFFFIAFFKSIFLNCSVYRNGKCCIDIHRARRSFNNRPLVICISLEQFVDTEMTELLKLQQIEKVVYCYGSDFLFVVARFACQVTGKHELKFFRWRR